MSKGGRLQKKWLGWIVILAVISVLAYVERASVVVFYESLMARFLPCYQPIRYSIGNVDSRFGLSAKDLQSAVTEAEKIWESAAGKELFVFEPEGSLKIQLIYDDRQASTQQLLKLGIVIGDDRKTYDQLKAKYQTAQTEYLNLKASYEKLRAEFFSRQSAYEKEVSTANKRGGASHDQYQRLEQERVALNDLAAQVNALQASLNQSVDTVNALANTLNRLAHQLNLSVDTYNTIGSSQGTEYEEGVFKTGPGGSEIDVYQFENRDKLVRVLAHEMGHALGIPHVEDPKAIMYRLNQGKNETLTADDIAELKRVCRLP